MEVLQDKRPPNCWRFANAQLDERKLELTVDGQIVDLERKPLEVLRYLLANADKALSHTEILDAVWPRRILSESVLKKCISRLREVLGDDDHRVIKTVHGHGYRFLVPVEIEQPRVAISAREPASSKISDVRQGAVLIVDVADSMKLRHQLGESAASRLLYELIKSIIAIARDHGGELIKSYGDDVMAVFERDPAASAAHVAIRAQKQAARSGLQLYAGIHLGEVEFRETLGHPDALGLTVNIAARLHKLNPGAPGQIFLVDESIAALPVELRSRTNRYGTRDLRGVGPIEIWTLRWQDTVETIETVFSATTTETEPPRTGLTLRHGLQSICLTPEQSGSLVGRGKVCVLRLLDPEARVSATHLLLECRGGKWLIQDISRNGTWLRTGDASDESTLPYCTQVMLPRRGTLSVGRPFADDAEGRFRVGFELNESETTA